MIRTGAYAAHEGFVEPARGSKELWKFVLGLVLAFVGYIALNQVFFQTLAVMQASSNPGYPMEVVRGLTPVPLLLLLASFGFMAISVGVVAVVVHRRSVLSLIGPLPLAIRQFATVLLPLVALGVVVFILPPWSMGAPLVPNLAPGLWLALLPLSLALVLVQVSAEEIVFRGYIQQQLAARFRSALVWMVLPSVLFALGHFLPDQAGENAWLIATWAGFFGILMADITARAGTLGPAIALHFFNNVTAILIVAMPDSLSGLSLFHAPFGLSETQQVRAWLPVDFVHMFVAWLVARLALRR